MAPAEPSYPSPTSAQVSAGTVPFYTHAADQDSKPQVPYDLQQLQATGAARNGAPAAPSPPPNSANEYDEDLHESIRNGLRDQTSQERVARGVLNMSDPQSFDTPEGQKGKRSKVSRACDECRRKKIRCDATSEQPEEPCSNCKRTGAVCRFSRQPMKRGPSKGYIKELADRLNTLESQLGPGAHAIYQGDPHYLAHVHDDGVEQRLSELQDFASPGTGSQLARKRTHSASEPSVYGREVAYPSPRQPPPGSWSAESSRQLPYPASGFPPPQTPGQPSADTPRQQYTGGSSSFWKSGGSETQRRETTAVPYGAEPREVEPSALPEWDDVVVDEYYRIVHQTLPVLPQSKPRLRGLLASCPFILREAFFAALDCSIRSSPSTTLKSASDLKRNTRKAAELISACQYENASSRTLSASLVYLQTLILMALESDNHGPVSTRGQFGPPRAEWLGRAIGVATHLKLNAVLSREIMARGDRDADEKLGRRLWWTLFILDRWHSSSTSSALQISENSNSLLPDDQIMLGESTFHLARLSFILGHLSSVLQQSPALMSPDSPATPIIATAINGEIERFRESVESFLATPNVVHLSYWHVRLLILRLTSATRPHELLMPATRIASMLSSHHTAITPLNHHFAALAALTLVELSAFEETRREAEMGIDDILQALDARRVPGSREDSAGWDGAIRDVVLNRRRPAADDSAAGDGRQRGGAAGLQRLADVAVSDKERGPDAPTSPGTAPGGAQATTATASTSSQGGAFDAAALTRFGYLAALARDDQEAR